MVPTKTATTTISHLADMGRMPNCNQECLALENDLCQQDIGKVYVCENDNNACVMQRNKTNNGDKEEGAYVLCTTMQTQYKYELYRETDSFLSGVVLRHFFQMRL